MFRTDRHNNAIVQLLGQFTVCQIPGREASGFNANKDLFRITCTGCSGKLLALHPDSPSRRIDGGSARTVIGVDSYTLS